MGYPLCSSLCLTPMLVHSTLKASPLGRQINRGCLKATTFDAQLFSILSNHMIRVSAPHPQRREGPSSAQLTTILCGYLASFVWVPGSFVYLHKCWCFRGGQVSSVTCYVRRVFFVFLGGGVYFFCNGKCMTGTSLKEEQADAADKTSQGIGVPRLQPILDFMSCIFSSPLLSPGCAPDRPLSSLPSDVWGTYGAVKLLSARACLCLSRLHQRD